MVIGNEMICTELNKSKDSTFLKFQTIITHNNNMKKRISLFAIIALVFATSCSDDQNNTLDTNGSSDKNAIIINNNQTQLNKRLDLSNSGVISIINPSTRKGLANESAQLPLTQIAEISAPKDSNGFTLQANHVAVNGNYAYVAYTSQGDEYSGAIDMIDVSDPYKPKLVMSALIPDTDISSLVYSNGKLILSGASNADKNPALVSPAVVMNLQLNSDGTFSSNLTLKDLSSFVSTDVATNASNYFAVSGDTGSLFKFDNSNNQIGNIEIEDLRTVAINNDKIVTLSGTKGISVFNTNLELTKSFSTYNEGKNGSKRTIDFVGDKILVSEGTQGLGVYNLATGAKNQSFPITPKTNIDPEDAVTNAVSVNEDYAFVANGGNGLDVYKTGDQLTLVGTVGIEGSSNYVKTSGDYIYVASGKGGLKIIKMERPAPAPSTNCDGLPAYSGDSNLNVNSGQVLGFSGSTALNWVNVNASLTLCGSTAIQNDLNINSGGILKMYGTLSQGHNYSYMNINGELQIEGSVVIWGNLTMNSGAKLTFLGKNSSITIYGRVTKNSGVTISGTYTDTENKLN